MLKLLNERVCVSQRSTHIQYSAIQGPYSTAIQWHTQHCYTVRWCFSVAQMHHLQQGAICQVIDGVSEWPLRLGQLDGGMTAALGCKLTNVGNLLVVDSRLSLEG
jgi:hypothetical protein